MSHAVSIPETLEPKEVSRLLDAGKVLADRRARTGGTCGVSRIPGAGLYPLSTFDAVHLPPDGARRGVPPRWGKRSLAAAEQRLEGGQRTCRAHGRWNRGMEDGGPARPCRGPLKRSGTNDEALSALPTTPRPKLARPAWFPWIPRVCLRSSRRRQRSSTAPATSGRRRAFLIAAIADCFVPDVSRESPAPRSSSGRRSSPKSRGCSSASRASRGSRDLPTSPRSP